MCLFQLTPFQPLDLYPSCCLPSNFPLSPSYLFLWRRKVRIKSPFHSQRECSLKSNNVVCVCVVNQFGAATQSNGLGSWICSGRGWLLWVRDGGTVSEGPWDWINMESELPGCSGRGFSLPTSYVQVKGEEEKFPENSNMRVSPNPHCNKKFKLIFHFEHPSAGLTPPWGLGQLSLILNWNFQPRKRSLFFFIQFHSKEEY